jgi:hypothetical protein
VFLLLLRTYAVGSYPTPFNRRIQKLGKNNKMNKRFPERKRAEPAKKKPNDGGQSRNHRRSHRNPDKRRRGRVVEEPIVRATRSALAYQCVRLTG